MSSYLWDTTLAHTQKALQQTRLQVPEDLENKRTQLVELQRQQQHSVDFIRAGHSSDAVADDLKRVDNVIRVIEADRASLESAVPPDLELPAETGIRGKLEDLVG